MPLHTPPPPSISPRQMTLMRIVASMAWSDGNLADAEVDLMLDRFSGLFADKEDGQQSLREELRDYLMQNLPLGELVPQLQDQAERELVLRLGYEVISSSARTPEENLINDEEATAYQTLVNLLKLPPEVVDRIESEAENSPRTTTLVNHMTAHLEAFFQE
ncbi:TerB family tellurite resistance protein [Leptolyngbya sp. PCC 6406]|uniref:tellurite resistance TerB family protein n=1 Tax=Leptolyngbya sp. PCC 6406 TaxID=1173264 RepID=UPI0002AC8E03|nr:TerB family tellurite resistance protein [Leptolyngbya sp. PCC 6406]